MDRIQLYIFNNSSDKGSAYGIGTYINQLTLCLHDENIDITIVDMYSEVEFIQINDYECYRKIEIPSIKRTSDPVNQYRYLRNVAYVLRSLITENEQQIIFHLNYLTAEQLVANLRFLFNCKIILTIHYTNWSFDLLGNYNQLKSLLEKDIDSLDSYYRKMVKIVAVDGRMIEYCDQLICVAKHTSFYLKDLYPIKDDKISVINNALRDTYIKPTDNEKDRIRKRYHIPLNSPVVIFAGRLDHVKGILFLVDSFKKVQKKHPDAYLLIAGDGVLWQALSLSVSQHPNIVLTGRLEKIHLYELYSIATIGVSTSLYEEFGLVAIEMMMHALPLIVTKTGGLDEIVEDGVSGLKVPVRTLKGKRQVDIECLSEKIDFLLNNPDYARKLGVNGRMRFLEKYEITLFKNRMLNLYRTI